MGKTSCLRIISCGGGSFESFEAGLVDQAKRSKQKKGWSFKKKSSSSRTVTNPCIEETPSLDHSVQSPASEATLSEKNTGFQWDKTSSPRIQVEPGLCETDAVTVLETVKQPTKDAVDSYVDDDDVFAPKTEKQSGSVEFCITDHLSDPNAGENDTDLAGCKSNACKELESIVRLQAMIRGHLVRSDAAGALRCVQAIAKMQVLVRARYARTRKDGTSPKIKPELTYTSMTGLLNSSFARQLLESSSNSRPIKFKCDPSCRDSSWVWLDRWMSLASPGAVDVNSEDEMVQGVKNIGEEHEEKFVDKEQQEKIIVEDYLFNDESDIFLDMKDFANPSFRCGYSKLDVPEERKLMNNSEFTLTNSNVDSNSASLSKRQKPDMLEEVQTVASSDEKDSVNDSAYAIEYSPHDFVFLDTKSEIKTEQSIGVESEVTELGNGLGKELKSEVKTEVVQPRTGNEIVSECHEDPDNLLMTESDLSGETATSNEDYIVINHQAAAQAEHLSLRIGESECDTELSITSTLDSADRLEFELEKVVSADVGSHEESDSDNGKDAFEIELGSLVEEKSDIVNGEPTKYATADELVMDEKEPETNVTPLHFHSEAIEEKKNENNISDFQAEPESDTERRHEAYPGSQVTISKSQGTPSSQISVSAKPKIAKFMKSGFIKKHTILSAAKKSQLNDSVKINTSEKQHEEQKYVKRRTSFESPKPEVFDQEHRRHSCSTSSSLPSYMQATKSVRAKANSVGYSPCSSSVGAENDDFTKKRHSISGTTKDKQDSPSLRRNLSQTQSSSRSNGTSPLERKWQG